MNKKKKGTTKQHNSAAWKILEIAANYPVSHLQRRDQKGKEGRALHTLANVSEKHSHKHTRKHTTNTPASTPKTTPQIPP